MNNEIIISHISMPYGVLHDQKLNSVKCENNQMIFTFDIKIFPQDYVGDCYKQYECYKHCDMIVAMKEESFNDFILFRQLIKTENLKVFPCHRLSLLMQSIMLIQLNL